MWGLRASAFAKTFGAPLHGKIAGLLHDLGKAETEFQKRLNTDDKQGIKEPHAHHGAMIALEKDAWSIAFAINGHHAGLHNEVIWEKERVIIMRKQKGSRFTSNI